MWGISPIETALECVLARIVWERSQAWRTHLSQKVVDDYVVRTVRCGGHIRK